MSAKRIVEGYWEAFSKIQHMKNFTSKEVAPFFNKSTMKTSGLLQSYEYRGYLLKLGKTKRENQNIYTLSPQLKTEIKKYLSVLEKTPC